MDGVRNQQVQRNLSVKMIANPKLDPPTLIGAHVRLRPIQAKDAAIYSLCTPIETFKFFVTQIPSEQSELGFKKYVDFIIDSPTTQGFTCELVENDRVVGGTTLMDIRPSDDHVEIGMTWYSPDLRGTYVNPECKYLLLTYAFEVLGCQKVTLKCDNRNELSKSAILKLGAKHEGVLRRHRFTENGEWRDTSYYGIVYEEWPNIKAGLEARLETFE
jgi:N-acetyltransferase